MCVFIYHLLFIGANVHKETSFCSTSKSSKSDQTGRGGGQGKKLYFVTYSPSSYTCFGLIFRFSGLHNYLHHWSGLWARPVPSEWNRGPFHLYSSGHQLWKRYWTYLCILFNWLFIHKLYINLLALYVNVESPKKEDTHKKIVFFFNGRTTKVRVPPLP